MSAKTTAEVLAEAAAVRERPILFTGEMVRAILAGTKTQTRRVIVPPRGADGVGVYTEDGTGVVEVVPTFEGEPIDAPAIRCPYGAPGDRLWVRETHYVERAGYPGDRDRFILYRATDKDAPVSKWTPAIHMYRWASRITLDLTEVRVERVQDISEEDARAEGVEPADERRVYPSARAARVQTYRAGFRALWDRINGPRGFGWEVNPWVWVLSFTPRAGAQREEER